MDVRDEAHFYFRFIEPHSAEIVSGNISFQQLAVSRAFQQWRGYAFERLCRKHASAIADHLRFSGISYKAGAWFQRGAKARPGGQIDLLFVRADKVLTACEMKYADRLSPSEVARRFEPKLDLLREAFPGYAVEKALVLGRRVRNAAGLRSHFDHVLIADQVFCGQEAGSE